MTITPEEVLTNSVVGPAATSDRQPDSVYAKRLHFLKSNMVSLEILKQRAKTADLSVHKQHKKKGSTQVKKVFFYPRAFKGQRSQASIVRFVRREDGTFSLTGNVTEVMAKWEKLRPSGDPGPVRKR